LRPNPIILAAPLLLALAAVPAALAQTERSGGGANAQLAQQYQQAQAEETQLQSDNDKLKKELDDSKKQLQAANKELVELESGGAAAQAQLAAAQQASQNAAQQLEQNRTRMQELVDRFRDTATKLRDVETDRSRLQQQVTQDNRDFDQCAERNYQLYQVDKDVLDRYEHQGLFSHLASAEPFTRIKRAQIENFVDDYRQRGEELQVQKAPQPVAGKN
jgi:chromosome segregation ATPase